MKYLILISLLFSSYLVAEPILDRAAAKTINKEFVEAMKNKDLSIIKKYMYRGSEIIIDLDPDNKKGEKKITYDEYINFTQRSIKKMGNSDVKVKLLSLSVNKAKNQATIKSRIKIFTQEMGNNFRFISTKKTLLGIVDNEIKILSSHDHLISIKAL